MQPTIIIVTGKPAAGKSTLAKWLGNELGFPVLSKDSVREILFDRLGWKDREWAELLGKASIDMMFYFAQVELQVGHSIIMDNTFNPVLSVPRFQELKNRFNAKSIQVICSAENETIFQRFKARHEVGERHPGHNDETVIMSLWEFLTKEYSSILDIGGQILEIDTTDFTKVDYQQILNQVKLLLTM